MMWQGECDWHTIVAVAVSDETEQPPHTSVIAGDRYVSVAELRSWRSSRCDSVLASWPVMEGLDACHCRCGGLID